MNSGSAREETSTNCVDPVPAARCGRRRGAQQLADNERRTLLPVNILFTDNIFAILSGPDSRPNQPVYSFTDTLSWTRGKHAFKTGFEVRFSSSKGFNCGDDPKTLFASVTIGTGGPSVSGISTIPGLTGSNVTVAQNLLLDLSGSVSNVSRSFYIQKPTDTEYTAIRPGSAG